MPVALSARTARLSPQIRLKPKIHQSIQIPVGYKNHIAALAAVAAVRPALFDKLLAPKRHRTVAAPASRHIHFRCVNKTHTPIITKNPKTYHKNVIKWLC
jgi:cobalamin biosynthesis protein CbiG